MILFLSFTAMANVTTRITLIIPDELARRLDKYCEESGHKKSTLIARWVRKQLDEVNPMPAPVILSAAIQAKESREGFKEQG